MPSLHRMASGGDAPDLPTVADRSTTSAEKAPPSTVRRRQIAEVATELMKRHRLAIAEVGWLVRTR